MRCRLGILSRAVPKFQTVFPKVGRSISDAGRASNRLHDRRVPDARYPRAAALRHTRHIRRQFRLRCDTYMDVRCKAVSGLAPKRARRRTLTSANYGDGNPNATPTWGYDPSGNRNVDSVQGNSWAYDDLNRMTSDAADTAYTNDILGNRLTKGTGGTQVVHTWDCLNRMLTYAASGTTTTYAYRADGMRVSKSSTATGTPTTLYRYDGEMGMEDVDSTTSTTTTTDYGLGSRGVDYISATTGGTTSVGFPIYDGHGNMVATLARGTGGTYNVSNQRSFDALGQIGSGSGTGDPKGRYCAAIGHKQDDESGLVYMRARYYDTASGRFASQDPRIQGFNWFTCCANKPVNRIDTTGKTGIWLLDLLVCGIISALLLCEAVVAIPVLVAVLIAVCIAFAVKAVLDAVLDGYENKMRLIDSPWHGEDPSSYALELIDNAKTGTSDPLALIYIATVEIGLWCVFAEDGS